MMRKLFGVLALAALVCLLIVHGLKAETTPSGIPSATEQSQETQEAQNSVFDPDDWRLTLVNPWHSLPDGYVPELTQLENGQSVDSRCYDDLQAMLDACRAVGYSPLVCSSYRTWEKQTTLFSNLLEKYRSQGLDEAAAYTAAAAEIAPPGTSEHQLGLALDIVSSAYQVLDENQADTPVQQWLMAHSWEYGFILRYPQDKSDLTGIIYEPWHYRYVGREAAEEIHRSGLCLEEFLAQIQ